MAVVGNKPVRFHDGTAYQSEEEKRKIFSGSFSSKLDTGMIKIM